MKPALCSLPLACALLLPLTSVRAAESSVAFDRAIQPILSRCVSCHGPGKSRGGLRLDGRAGALAVLDSGARAVVPGKPELSELLHRVTHTDPRKRMPPKGEPVSPAQVEALRRWIAAGAEWPEHWAYRPLHKPVPPGNLGETSLDRFLVARLAEQGLALSPPADRRTLLRRVTFDLIGLPPTPEEMDSFLADASPDAYERVVDRLLASPHYGERWARHWMDLAHFAETHGHDQDRPRDHAWPYRDYLVRSFNSDKPYARFVQEQVAGDVLFPEDPWATVATGFLAAGPWDESSLRDIREDSLDREIGRYLDRDDIVSTVIGTFASTTVHCARCHDHKFDPITQKEYYALQAVFAATDKANRLYDPDPSVAARRRRLNTKRAQVKKWKETQDAALCGAGVQAEVAAWEQTLPHPVDGGKLPSDVAAILDTPGAQRTDRQRAELAAYYLEQKYEHELAEFPSQPLVYCGTNHFTPDGSFAPSKSPRTVRILKRGDARHPGEVAEPGTLSCVPGLEARFTLPDPTNEGARRAALARWLTDRRNGLVWRSIVNRVWQYHFGKGLVNTPNDFGHMGSLPTHPELLDWLAVTFQERGGSLKQLHRLMVTSAVYRQSSRSDPDAAAKDTDNCLLWHSNRQRLDAEAIHDALLVFSGKLDRAMGGPSVRQFHLSPGVHVTPNVDYLNFDPDNPVNYRRSVYRFLFRTLPDPLMEALDCPDGSQVAPVRNASVTAIQALALLNDKFVVRQTEHIAERIGQESAEPERQVELLYRLVLGRMPTDEERRAVGSYARKYGLANACRVLVNSNEFVFVD